MRRPLLLVGPLLPAAGQRCPGVPARPAAGPGLGGGIGEAPAGSTEAAVVEQNGEEVQERARRHRREGATGGTSNPRRRTYALKEGKGDRSDRGDVEPHVG